MKNRPEITKYYYTTLALIAGIWITTIPSFAQVATATVNINSVVTQNASLLLGITYDCRSSLNLVGYGQVGYHNPDGSFIAGIDSVFKDFPMSGLRYPANGISQGFEWKRSIGPVAGRTPQQIFAQQLNPPQVMVFGFDEFMAMTASRGVNPKNVQIMVPIYDSADISLNATQLKAAIPNVIQSNADWVEYCNAPNNGSNPGGGTDWAAIRAANGHANPYGIEIWNMGNEPYTDAEFGIQGADNYINLILPNITAMLAIDPTIKITVTLLGKATSAWSITVLNSSLLQGKIYGVNSHVFTTEELINNSIPYGVSVYETGITGLAAAAKAKGYKYIIGDYAHAILGNQPTAAAQDLAMQWQGANSSMDFLITMSQIDNIERSDFWTFGNTSAVWHPIRKNSNGSYTSMPLAELYKKINPLFLDNSISVISTSPVASDGNPYSVRSGAFASTDLAKVNVISVNRDKVNTIPLKVSGLTGYTLSNSRLLSATALNADIIDESTISANVNGDFSMPAMSILILEYTKTTTRINEVNTSPFKINLYPNPTNGLIYFSRTLNNIEVFNVIGQRVLSAIKSAKSISILGLRTGIYFIRSDEVVMKFIVKR